MLFPIFVRQGKSQSSFKVGYVSADGQVVINPVFEEGTRFYEGMASVKLKGRWGVINPNGDFVIQPNLWNLCQFRQGLASVTTKSGKYGVIDLSGNCVIPPKYDYIGPFESGLALIRIGESEKARFGFIDRAGTETIAVQFRSAKEFSGGYAAVKEADLWGYIYPSGDYAITPRFQSTRQTMVGRREVSAGNFAGGLAPVWSGDEGYRFIEDSGEYAFDSSFDDAKSYHEGRAVVKRSKLFGFIDADGEVAIDFKYTYANPYSEGLARVTCDEPNLGFYPPSGFIDFDNQMVIPAKFQSAESFQGGLSLVTTQDLIAYINKRGEFVWQESYVDYGVLL